MISRNGQTIIPEGSTTIEAGDTVFLVSCDEGILDVNDIYDESFGGYDSL